MKYPFVIKFIIIVLLITQTSTMLFAQQLLLWKKKAHILKDVSVSYNKYHRKFTQSETDTTLTFYLKDSLSLPLTSIFYFNTLNNNLCERIDIIYTCDSCLKKAVQFEIQQNNFLHNWRQISKEAYYAKFPWNTSMECVREKDNFILRYTKQSLKAFTSKLSN